MKEITVYWSELTDAFTFSTTGADYYLDTNNGRVLLVLEDNQYQLNDVYRKHRDPDNPDAFDIEAALAKTDLQDWEKEMIADAHAVEQYFGFHIIAIPDMSSHDNYVVMESFITAMENGRLRDELWDAIQKRKPFRRFRYILEQNPDDLQRWYDYKDEYTKNRTIDWLEDINDVEVELDYGNRPSEE